VERGVYLPLHLGWGSVWHPGRIVRNSQWWPIFKARHLTPATCLCISLRMLGEGQLIRELKLGEVNPDRMRI
jgi:hypothetical protein